MDIGFEYAGFENLASVEVNELFCNTLRLNNPGHLVIGPPEFSGDIRDRETIVSILRESLGISSSFEGLFHGGPPCQPFSIAPNQRYAKEDENFKRNGFSDKEKGSLLNDYVWFFTEFRPKVFVMENVPGLFDIDKGVQLNKALERLARAGYSISRPQVVNAAYHGVPQNRLRLIVVGTSTDRKFEFPKPNGARTACHTFFVDPPIDVQNHMTREHAAQSVLRYMVLDYG